MTVRLSLLAMLAEQPAYGNRLRSEFERRTAGAWALNVGQVYTTLARLERDGLVRKHGEPERGQQLWEVTDAGRLAAREWFTEPVPRSALDRDELAMKLAMALDAPGVDLAAMLVAQRATTSAALADALERSAESLPLAQELALLAQRGRLRAELDWLAIALERLEPAQAASA